MCSHHPSTPKQNSEEAKEILKKFYLNTEHVLRQFWPSSHIHTNEEHFYSVLNERQIYPMSYEVVLTLEIADSLKQVNSEKLRLAYILATFCQRNYIKVLGLQYMLMIILVGRVPGEGIRSSSLFH